MTDSVIVPRDGQDASAPAAPRRSKRGWFRAGESAPQTRRRRPLVRVFLALSSGTALIGIVGLVTAAAFVPPIGERRAARALADREVRAQLRTNEQVVARVFASQRRWTDMYRESYGVVAATTQRVLYVGAPPMPLLRPREDGPEELLVESYPYDAAFTLEPTTLFRGLARGLALRTPEANVAFLVDNGVWTDAVAVSRASADARRAVTQDDAALAESYRASLPAATVYVTHIVQRGETLTGLARRFATSPDVLRQLNQLASDTIRSGQRLRVPRVDDVP